MNRIVATQNLMLLVAGLSLPSCADNTIVFGGGGAGGGTGTGSGTETGTGTGAGTDTGTGTGTATGTATGTGSGTGSGTGTATGTGTGAGTGTGTGTGTGSGTGTGTGGPGGGGPGGAGGGCAHDECEFGPPLEQSCSNCALLICLQDAYCCTTLWDDLCIDAADQQCSGVDCGASVVDCDTQYDTVAGYRSCAENASSCEFSFDNYAASCEKTCADHGGECLDAWDNTNGSWCDFEQDLTCAHVGAPGDGFGQYNVCQCSRGCGSGPPCIAPATCQGGFCL